MRLSPSVLTSAQDEKNFILLLRTEGELGGYHVQFNVVGTDTLLDAQQAIINRTEQAMW